PISHQVYCYAFRRGFVEEVTVNALSFLRLGESLFAAAPIRLARIIGARLVMDRLCASPWVARLGALHLTGARIGDEGGRLLATSSHLRSLRTLRLGDNALGDDAIEELTSSNNFSELQVLVLGDNQIKDDGAYLLANCRAFPNLHTLDLRNNEIGAAGAEMLA